LRYLIRSDTIYLPIILDDTLRATARATRLATGRPFALTRSAIDAKERPQPGPRVSANAVAAWYPNVTIGVPRLSGKRSRIALIIVNFESDDHYYGLASPFAPKRAFALHLGAFARRLRADRCKTGPVIATGMSKR